MTKFIFQDQKYIINSLQIRKSTIQSFLIQLYHQYPYPKSFTIKEINCNKSDKTIRAIISVFLTFNYIEIINKKADEIPKIYQFKNKDLNELLLHLSKMG